MSDQSEVTPMTSAAQREEQTMDRTCPDGAALNIKGEHFPCQTMADMAPECDGHEGWAHSNRDAEAIWQ